MKELKMKFNNIIEYEFKRNGLKLFLIKEYNFSITECIILLKIREIKKESITLKELKELCNIDRVSISPIISRLVSLKYFKKERLKDDERMVRIYDIDYFKIETFIKRIEVIYYMIK